jgi:hypothetical protein
MIEQRFWRYKSAVSSFMLGSGCLCLIIAATALGFGIFFSLKTSIQKPTPRLEIQVGKKYTQKLPEPVPDAPIAIVFDKLIAKEMPKYPDNVRNGTLYEPMKIQIDLGGGQKDDAGKPLHPEGIATFSIDRPRLGRSGKLSPWRLSDDDAAKFGKFYLDFVSKQPPDLVAAKNEEYSGMGYHYAWVLCFWGVVLVGVGTLIKRFDPDLY